MHYAIVVFESEQDFKDRTDPSKNHINMGAYLAYSRALEEAGVMRGGAGLELPHTATVVKLRDGKRIVQDGPFIASKEQLGGFFLIEVDTLDEALAWAARCPAARSAGVEVRPLLPPPPSHVG